MKIKLVFFSYIFVLILNATLYLLGLIIPCIPTLYSWWQTSIFYIAIVGIIINIFLLQNKKLNFKNTFSKKYFRIIVVLFIAFIVLYIVPILLNGIIKWKYGNSVNDNKTWLSFWGSYIGAIGAILLGTFALWQNRVYKQQSDKYNEEIKALTIVPEIYLERITHLRTEANDERKINSIDGENSPDTYYMNLKSLNLPVINIRITKLKINNDIYCNFYTNYTQSIFENLHDFTQQLEIPKKYKNADIDIDIEFTFSNIYSIEYIKNIKLKRSHNSILPKIIYIKNANPK